MKTLVAGGGSLRATYCFTRVYLYFCSRWNLKCHTYTGNYRKFKLKCCGILHTVYSLSIGKYWLTSAYTPYGTAQWSENIKVFVSGHGSQLIGKSRPYKAVLYCRVKILYCICTVYSLLRATHTSLSYCITYIHYCGLPTPPYHTVYSLLYVGW